MSSSADDYSDGVPRQYLRRRAGRIPTRNGSHAGNARPKTVSGIGSQVITASFFRDSSARTRSIIGRICADTLSDRKAIVDRFKAGAFFGCHSANIHHQLHFPILTSSFLLFSSGLIPAMAKKRKAQSRTVRIEVRKSGVHGRGVYAMAVHSQGHSDYRIHRPTHLLGSRSQRRGRSTYIQFWPG